MQGQDISAPIKDLLKLFDNHREKIIDDYFTFLRFPSVSTEPEHEKQTLACAAWLENYLLESGLVVERHETDGHPLLVARWDGAGASAETVMIYGHYDVQPVDPIELWQTPPFEPTVIDNEVFARGASDNKGQIFFAISAVRVLLSTRGKLPCNVMFCIEGDEEGGSKGLAKTLHEISDKIQAQHLMIVDVSLERESEPVVTIGMRGIAALTVEISESKTDLHSGVHGGLAFNPNHALVSILAKLRDDNGRILVPGFYDDVAQVEQGELARLSMDFDLADYQKCFGFSPKGGERALSPIERRWLRPTLEINGVSGGYAGSGFKTVIPSRAVAKISTRLVPNQDPDKTAGQVAQFLKDNTPEGVKCEVTIHPGGGRAVRSNPDSKIVKTAARAFSEMFGQPCGLILEGATIPIVTDLAKASGAQTVLIGYGLSTDQIHAPNEHFGLERFRKGFATIARILELVAENSNSQEPIDEARS